MVSSPGGIAGEQLWRFFSVNGVEDLAAVDRGIPRRFDSQPDLVAPDLDNGDGNIVVDHNALVFLAAEYKHGCLSDS